MDNEGAFLVVVLMAALVFFGFSLCAVVMEHPSDTCEHYGEQLKVETIYDSGVCYLKTEDGYKSLVELIDLDGRAK